MEKYLTYDEAIAYLKEHGINCDPDSVPEDEPWKICGDYVCEVVGDYDMSGELTTDVLDDLIDEMEERYEECREEMEEDSEVTPIYDTPEFEDEDDGELDEGIDCEETEDEEIEEPIEECIEEPVKD